MRAKILRLIDQDTRYLVVLWAPVPVAAQAILADPNKTSEDPNISPADLAQLRAGAIHEHTITPPVGLRRAELRQRIEQAWQSFVDRMAKEAVAVAVGAYLDDSGQWVEP